MCAEIIPHIAYIDYQISVYRCKTKFSCNRAPWGKTTATVSVSAYNQ